MANVLFGGFHVDQNVRSNARRYPVASNNGTAIFRGDIVTIATTGLVSPATGGGGTTTLLGAVKEVEYTLNGKRIRGPYLPANTTYSGGAYGRDESFVWVYDDPLNEFWASVDSAATTNTSALWEAAVGSNFDLIAGAGSTVYGCSGHTVDGVPQAVAANFRCLEVRRVPGRSFTGSNIHVKVLINEGFHAFVNTAGI